MCRFWTAVFDQPDWTRPYQQYTDTPGGTYWCTATAELVIMNRSRWPSEPVRACQVVPGRGTANDSTSNPPTRTATPCLRCSWPTVGRTPPGQALESTPHCSPAFPPVRSLGVDQTEVLKLFERHQAENR